MVKDLTTSIKEDGFWGGVVCRHGKDGDIEVGAGHTRVKVAIAAGIEAAHLHVAEMDDAALIRVYACENATRRGTVGTAQVGSVAATVRFVAQGLLVGEPWKMFHGLSKQEMAQAKAGLLSEDGIGLPIILRFLEGVPGINEGTVKQALKDLKTSGD